MNQIEDRNAVSDDGYNEMMAISSFDWICLGFFMIYGLLVLAWNRIEHTVPGRAAVYAGCLVLFVCCVLWRGDRPEYLLGSFAAMYWTADRFAKLVMEEACGPS